MFRSYFSTIIFSALVAFSIVTGAHSEEISIHGSTTVYTHIFKKHEAAIEEQSGIKLNIIANGSGRGIGNLLDGKANMAMISAPLETLVTKINKKTPGRITQGSLVGHEIGKTQIAFIVHASNPVKSLTLEQVKGILLGKIKNWSEVGGQNKPIIVVSEDNKGGIRALTEKKALGGKSISATGRKEVPNGSQVAKVTAQIPFAFGVSSPASASANTKILTTDKEISQPLILVTKGNATESMKKVISAAGGVSSK